MAEITSQKEAAQPNPLTKLLQEQKKEKTDSRKQLIEVTGNNEMADWIEFAAGQFETAFLQRAIKFQQQGESLKDFEHLLRELSCGFKDHVDAGQHSNLEQENADIALRGFCAAVSGSHPQFKPESDPHKQQLAEDARNMKNLLSKIY